MDSVSHDSFVKKSCVVTLLIAGGERCQSDIGLPVQQSGAEQCIWASTCHTVMEFAVDTQGPQRTHPNDSVHLLPFPYSGNNMSSSP